MLAHSGHWLTQLIFLAPVVAVVLWVAVATIRARRRGDDRDGVGAGTAPD